MTGGIICINKPQEFTSCDVIAIVRKTAGTRKLGHSGTLDPMATGVLPVFIGRAAKAVDLNPDNVKAYRAGFKLGYESDTEDIWGNVTQSDNTHISLDMVKKAVEDLKGDMLQTPPMYSAVKVGGKKLYQLARQGIEIERQPRPITIHDAGLISYDEEKREGVITVTCSKGTYIRTLICDMAKNLSTRGIMTSLERTLSGGFSLSDCITIDKVRTLTTEELYNSLIPVDRIFTCYDRVELSDKQRKMFLNGVVLDTERMNIDYANGTNLRIYHKDDFLGLGVVTADKA